MLLFDAEDNSGGLTIRYGTCYDLRIRDYLEEGVVFRLTDIGGSPIILGYP